MATTIQMRDLVMQLKSLRQGTKGVKEYYIELMSLRFRTNWYKNDWDMQRRFVLGLNRSIREKV